MPELIYEAQDQIPEALKTITVEKDGKWVANVVPKTELDDFRNRNIEISRDRDNLTSVIGRLTTDVGLDLENLDGFVTSFAELKDVKQQVEDGKLVKDTSLAQAVEAKTGEMKRTFEGQINGLKNENTSLKGENEKLKSGLNRSIVDREVMQAVNDPQSGALPEATRQILREAYETFSIEDGKLVAKDKDNNVLYGTDGATVMTPLEWLHKLQETSPFFFKQAQGGGGGGGGGGGSLTAAQLAAMTPEEKMNYGRKNGMAGR
jgi:regulator of replication initiation timing